MKDAIPQGSWSWSVVLLCFVINFLHFGLARLSGLLYLASITRYDASRSQASLPFVLCYTVRNVSGPLIGYIGRKIDVRVVIISGCILASFGVGACFFAEDILTVTILWGGVFGLGFGLGTILIPEVLKQHSEKYIASATGIAYGSECVAGFLLPVLFEFLLNTYGVSGSFLIFSGLILHSIPAAMLLKTYASLEQKLPHKNNNRTIQGLQIVSNDSYSAFENSDASEKGVLLGTNDILKPANSVNNLREELYQQIKPNYTASAANGPSVKDNQYESSTLESPQLLITQKSLSQNIKTVDDSVPNTNCQLISPMETKHLDGVVKADTEVLRSQEHSTICAFGLFLDPSFLLIVLTQSSMIFISTMVITIIVDFSRDMGASSSDEVYVLMSISVADMVGRFGLGWVIDGGYMSNVAFSAWCYAGMAVLMAALVLLKGFTTVMSASILFGLFLGGLVIVGPGVVFDCMEEDRVTLALASRFFLYAPVSLLQSPLIGFFRGSLGSYDGIFYILGVLCLLCCIFSFLIPYTSRCHKRRKSLNK